MKAVFEEEERNNKKGAKANTGSAAKPIVNHQIDSDEAVLKTLPKAQRTRRLCCALVTSSYTILDQIPKFKILAKHQHFDQALTSKS